MAKQDFYGEWSVEDTTGTPFGLGTSITIAPGVDGDVDIVFEPPIGEPRATYDEGMEALLIFGLPNIGVLFVSRYVDQAADFYGIYGLALVGSNLRTAVFMATGERPPDAGSLGSSAISGSDFIADFKISTTCGAQFGKGSTVAIGQAEEDVCTLAISNVAGESVKAPDTMVFDPLVCALGGAMETEENVEIRLQVSLAVLGSRRYVYGLSVYGDPEEAGAWGGGEEESEPPPEPLESKSVKKRKK